MSAYTFPMWTLWVFILSWYSLYSTFRISIDTAFDGLGATASTLANPIDEAEPEFTCIIILLVDGLCYFLHIGEQVLIAVWEAGVIYKSL